MSDSQKKILEMLAENKITADEADLGKADGLSPKVRTALLDWAAVLNTAGSGDAAAEDRTIMESGPDWMLPACTALTCKGERSSKVRSFSSLFQSPPDGPL